jgi:Baseplate J-like protein
MSFSTLNLPADPPEVENPNDQLAIEDAGYTGPDVETDERAIADAVFAALAARVAGWVAHDGNLETWLIEAFAAIAAEIRTLAADVPAAIFTTYGEEVLALPIRVPAPATGASTWIAEDALGYEIPVGTQITLPRSGDDLAVFQVVVGATIAPGQTTIADVQIAATEAGGNSNGLSGPAEVVDPLGWVQSIDVPVATAGGDDGQDPDEYVDDLSQLMRMIALRPILPGDFALLALRSAGVGRAVAMDNYDPATGTWTNARMITLILTDDQGEPVPQAIKDTVRAQLEELREVNFVVNIIDAGYENIDVDFAVTAYAEQDATIVQSACADALTNYLAPANWRLGTTSPATAAGEIIPPVGAGETPGRQTVRVNELIGLLDRTRGVDWVDTVTINGAAADHQLAGPMTLPRPGAITGSVTVQ